MLHSKSYLIYHHGDRFQGNSSHLTYCPPFPPYLWHATFSSPPPFCGVSPWPRRLDSLSKLLAHGGHDLGVVFHVAVNITLINKGWISFSLPNQEAIYFIVLWFSLNKEIFYYSWSNIVTIMFGETMIVVHAWQQGGTWNKAVGTWNVVWSFHLSGSWNSEGQQHVWHSQTSVSVVWYFCSVTCLHHCKSSNSNAKCKMKHRLSGISVFSFTEVWMVESCGSTQKDKLDCFLWWLPSNYFRSLTCLHSTNVLLLSTKPNN